MINGYFELPQEAKDAMNEARQLAEKLAHDYLRITTNMSKCDEATVTLVLRQIQALKNQMCDAFITPYGPKEFKLEGESETVKKRKQREAAVVIADKSSQDA